MNRSAGYTREVKTPTLPPNAQPALPWDQLRSDSSCYDEFRDSGGNVRPHWRTLRDQLNRLGPTGLAERSRTISQLMYENGTTFSIDGADEETRHPWQLSVVPYCISPADWSALRDGIAQRTRLLELVLQDLLGEQQLITNGVIPGELIWGNPRFNRAFHRLLPNDAASTQILHVTATDLARAQDGQWRVMGDRTRAPSGLGYLLENRILIGRVLPSVMRSSNTYRLAAFFEKLREHLRSIATENTGDPRVVLLTPPSGNYREFEDSYLARYLGITLVRGSDLAVRGGKLHLKTLGGLLPIEVLWRHISDWKCDPLELEPSSNEGVTGLLRCVRHESVAVANSIGSALGEIPGLLAYLDRACHFFWKTPLELPSVKTYWCGDPEHRQCVLSNIDRYVFKHAYIVSGDKPYLPDRMSDHERQQFLTRLREHPQQLIAQDKVSYSQTPIWTDGSIESRKVALRSFQLTSAGNVEVLPGGLARVDQDASELSRSPVSGQITQDCWVTSENPVDSEKTLLPSDPSITQLRRGGEELPSRVAEHLFWLGRYTERAEGIARTMRATLQRISGEDNWELLDEVRRLIYSLASLGQIEPGFAVDSLSANLPQVESSLPASVLDPAQPRGLAKTMESIMHNATAVRDRLTVDAYRIISRCSHELNRPVANQPSGLDPSTTLPVSELSIGEAVERTATLIVDLLAFAGVISESFIRSHAWLFLDLGRRIERAGQVSELVTHLLGKPTTRVKAVCETLLEITDSLMTYRSRYRNLVQLAPTVDLIVTDETNPRSIRYQVDQIANLLNGLPSVDGPAGLDEIQRRALDLQHGVTISDPFALCESSDDGDLPELEKLMSLVIKQLPKLSDAVSARFLIHTTRHELTGSIR